MNQILQELEDEGIVESSDDVFLPQKRASISSSDSEDHNSSSTPKRKRTLKKRSERTAFNPNLRASNPPSGKSDDAPRQVLQAASIPPTQQQDNVKQWSDQAPRQVLQEAGVDIIPGS